MNIDKELQALIFNKKNTSSILEDLYEEQKNLENKVHIFEVLHEAENFQKLIESGLLKDSGIYSIVIDLLFYKKGMESSWTINDENGIKIDKAKISDDLLNEIEGCIESGNICATKTKYGTSNSRVELVLDNTFQENFIDFMLKTEVKSMLDSATKTILSFIELENSLPNNKVNDNNKKKI